MTRKKMLKNIRESTSDHEIRKCFLPQIIPIIRYVTVLSELLIALNLPDLEPIFHIIYFSLDLQKNVYTVCMEKNI